MVASLSQAAASHADSCQSTTEDKKSHSDHHYKGRVIFLWKCLKMISNCLAFFTGLLNAPFARRGEIPWDEEDDEFDLPINQLVEKIKKGELSSVRLVTHYINRIKRLNPLINAVIDMSKDEALSQAASVDRAVEKILRGDSDSNASVLSKPLLGIPFSCKDSMGVKGMLQSAGCHHRRSKFADQDAQVVRKLRSAGAIPLAITNVPEILLWWETNNLVYGRTSNPHDLSRITGGSSGGEAALISSNGIPFGVGSDMGGSIRIPSFYCGIFGHKTSPRLIDTRGMWPQFPEALNDFISFGPMARRVCDLKLTLKCMMEDESKIPIDNPVDLSKVKLLWMIDAPGNPLTSPTSQEITIAIEDAVRALEKKHCIHAEKVSFPLLAHAIELWAVCIRELDPRGVKDVLEEVSGEKVNVTMELIKSVVGLSDHSFNSLFLATVQKSLDSPNGSKRHIALKNAYERVKKEVLDSLSDNTVLISSTMPETAPKHCSTPWKGTDSSFASAANTLGLPSTQVPIRLSNDGLPIGLQVASAPYNDHLCLAVAESLEEIFGGYKRP